MSAALAARRRLGERIIVEATGDLPLVTLHITFAAGAAGDPPGKEGLTEVASELIRRGAGSRTRAQIDAAFDALGGSFDIYADHDNVTLGGTVLARNADAYAALVQEILGAPHLGRDEFDKLMRECIAELDEMRDDDRTLVRRFFDRTVFAGHPYGRPVGGTAPSLASLELADVRQWVSRALTRDGTLVGIAGNVTPRTAARLAKATLIMPATAAMVAPLPAPPKLSGRRIVVVDKPERTQSQILLGHPGVRWADLADFAPLEVVMTAFGGMFTSRLMTEVRVKRGWSYGARARMERARGQGAFSMYVFPSDTQTARTVRLVLDLYDTLVKQGLGKDELAFARSYLVKSFAFEIDTPERRLGLRMNAAAAGLPDDYIDRYPALIQKVNAGDVARVIKKYLTPNDLTVVLVATAKKLRRALSALPVDEVTTVAYDSY